MTKRDLKIWLAINEMRQVDLAEKLGVGTSTIGDWNAAGKYPQWLPYALIGITQELSLEN